MSGDCLDVYVGIDNSGCPIYSLIYDDKSVGGGRLLSGNERDYWVGVRSRITIETDNRNTGHNVINGGYLQLGFRGGKILTTKISDDHLKILE